MNLASTDLAGSLTPSSTQSPAFFLYFKQETRAVRVCNYASEKDGQGEQRAPEAAEKQQRLRGGMRQRVRQHQQRQRRQRQQRHGHQKRGRSPIPLSLSNSTAERQTSVFLRDHVIVALPVRANTGPGREAVVSRTSSLAPGADTAGAVRRSLSLFPLSLFLSRSLSLLSLRWTLLFLLPSLRHPPANAGVDFPDDSLASFSLVEILR